MTSADLVAQLIVWAVLMTALANRNLLEDMMDGNVERLEREERASEASWWLEQINRSKEYLQ